jgi:hypothetical protein
MAEELRFDAERHEYWLGQHKVPGVTRVLELLEDWQGVPAHVLAAARQRGQLVHEACALLVRERLDWQSLDPELVPYLIGAKNFLEQSGVIVIASEVRVAHRVNRYAGTLDLLCEMNQQLGLYDFKSGTVPRTVGPQTAAYVEAYEDARCTRVRRRYCVQLNPDLPQGYRLHALTNTTDWNIFLSALNCWRFKNAA